MKAMSLILKLLAILGFVATALSFFNGELEASIGLLVIAIFLMAAGVLFKNLGEAFEDIAYKYDDIISSSDFSCLKKLIDEGFIPNIDSDEKNNHVSKKIFLFSYLFPSFMI